MVLDLKVTVKHPLAVQLMLLSSLSLSLYTYLGVILCASMAHNTLLMDN